MRQDNWHQQFEIDVQGRPEASQELDRAFRRMLSDPENILIRTWLHSILFESSYSPDGDETSMIFNEGQRQVARTMIAPLYDTGGRDVG